MLDSIIQSQVNVAKFSLC